ncbi:metallophosphoesterase [Candidatus Uhrbacteria bacterium]|jgi:uncharacterized protein|nr:metallophosphoesterase [Candidatus Uhrbacteria bacterium]MBT7716965.1 metallophosphoesterase [Candidatus Uhrbacteria bacterium]
MNILAIADRRPQRSIKKLVEDHDIDLICTLGDFDGADLQELEGIEGIPKIGVYGNHCSGKYFESLGIQNMHLNTWDFNGIKFGGFQGSVRYKESPYAIMYTQEEALELMKDFPKVDIFISHAPPYKIHDDPDELSHQGFHALREYIDRCHPRFLLHGHTYPPEEDWEQIYNKTHVVFVTEEKILKLPL